MKENKVVTQKHPEYETVIGIEVHVQLKTKSKLFCACQNKFGAYQNTNVCEICLGLLGTLPVLNKRAVDFAIKAGIATNCSISKVCDFARKHYMYPDLPKNYQITQNDKPICKNGYVAIQQENGVEKKVRLNRIHMEEDAGKILHLNSVDGASLIDFNRAGTPLIEIVSEPDISSSIQARDYLMKLRSIMQYLDISTANMEEGSFRADINVSVKKKTASALGTKVELKNINSFKFVEMAIEFEIDRQIDLLERGEKIIQETRSWNEKDKKTVFMRSKEDSQDYRYFPDPDLPILIIDQEWIGRLKDEVPELPCEKIKRFQEEYGLSLYESEILTQQQAIAEFFEKTTKKCNSPRAASNWILRDLLEFLNDSKTGFETLKVTPEMLAELIFEVEQNVINSTVARTVFIEMAKTGRYPSIIIQERCLEQINSEAELTEIAQKIIADFPKQFADFKAGNSALLGFFVGKSMKYTDGKVNPQIMSSIFMKML